GCGGPRGKARSNGLAIGFFKLPANTPASDLASLVDWNFMQRIGLELGLIDLSRLDVPVSQCLVRDDLGELVQRSHRSPGAGTMMHTPGPRVFCELDAAYLNRTAGRGRLENKPYLGSFPDKFGLLVLDAGGCPLSDVAITVYQRDDSGRDGLIVDDQQIYIGDSKAGRFDLPARPGAAGSVATSFGPVAFDGSNGVFLVRLSKNLATEYHFATILDFCLAAARGDKAFDLPIRTQ